MTAQEPDEATRWLEQQYERVARLREQVGAELAEFAESVEPQPVGFVIHPQTGGVCYVEGRWDWTRGAEMPVLARWPVPRLANARLVDCTCGKTGILPMDMQAAARYIPGATLSPDGTTVTLGSRDPLALISEGGGEDEVGGEWHVRINAAVRALHGPTDPDEDPRRTAVRAAALLLGISEQAIDLVLSMRREAEQ